MKKFNLQFSILEILTLIHHLEFGVEIMESFNKPVEREKALLKKLYDDTPVKSLKQLFEAL